MISCMESALLYSLGSVLIISLTSFVGVFLLSLQERILKKIVLYLVAFATGAIFANVFFHLLPEAVELSEDLSFMFGLVLAGVILSFIIEKFIHWHHCHNLDCDEHVRPIGKMILLGDAVHNSIDGILIATTYLIDIRLGIATTLAVVLHEIPQEIGDFAVLIHGGCKTKKALLLNFLSALTAFVGVVLVFVLREYMHGIELILLPLAAGNFLYIAGSDLIPELHREVRAKKALLQLLAMLGGIVLMYGLIANVPIA